MNPHPDIDLAQWSKNHQDKVIQETYQMVTEKNGIPYLLRWVRQTTPEQRSGYAWVDSFLTHMRNAVAKPDKEQTRVLELYSPHLFFSPRAPQLLPLFEQVTSDFPLHHSFCSFLMEPDTLNWLQGHYSTLLPEEVSDSGVLTFYQWLVFYLPEHPFLPCFKTILQEQRALYHLDLDFLPEHHPHAHAQKNILRELSSIKIDPKAHHQTKIKHPFRRATYWTEDYWDFWEYHPGKSSRLLPWLTVLNIQDPQHLAMHYAALPSDYQEHFRSFLIHEAHASPSVLMPALEQVIRWDIDLWTTELRAIQANPALQSFVERSLNLSLTAILEQLIQNPIHEWTQAQSNDRDPLETLTLKPRRRQLQAKTPFLKLRTWLHHWEWFNHYLSFHHLNILLLLSPRLHPDQLMMVSKPAMLHPPKDLPVTQPPPQPSKNNLLPEAVIHSKRLHSLSSPRMAQSHGHLKAYTNSDLSMGLCLQILLHHPHREAWLSLAPLSKGSFLAEFQSDLGEEKVQKLLSQVRQKTLNQHLIIPVTPETGTQKPKRL